MEIETLMSLKQDVTLKPTKVVDYSEDPQEEAYYYNMRLEEPLAVNLHKHRYSEHETRVEQHEEAYSLTKVYRQAVYHTTADSSHLILSN